MFANNLNRATGVSVGRFIVYYYRFAPTNTDRTWDIGIAISVAEPSTHIMSACAPATKCLFRYLFPYFARSRTPAYYEERNTTQRTPNMSKFGSRGSRRTLGSFHFGLSNNGSRTETTAMEEITRMAPTVARDTKSDKVYGLSRINSIDSETTINKYNNEEKHSVEVRDAARSSGTKTATTSLSEPVEAEPLHCLAHAK